MCPPLAATPKLVRRPMTSQTSDLADFGWNNFFSLSTRHRRTEPILPVRVMAVHRDRLHVAGPAIERSTTAICRRRPVRRVRRNGRRLAAARSRNACGRAACCSARACSSAAPPAPAASCSSSPPMSIRCSSSPRATRTSMPARLERYLALAREAEVTPVDRADQGRPGRCAGGLCPRSGRACCPACSSRRSTPASAESAARLAALVRARPDGRAGRLVRRRQVDAGQHADRNGSASPRKAFARMTTRAATPPPAARCIGCRPAAG